MIEEHKKKLSPFNKFNCPIFGFQTQLFLDYLETHATLVAQEVKIAQQNHTRQQHHNNLGWKR